MTTLAIKSDPTHNPKHTTNDPALTPLAVAIGGLPVLLERSIPALERDDVAGRIPRPFRIGRSKRWRIAEIIAWVEAGCPDRKTWEATRRLAGR